ncbi:MAG TPA: hypothetical protein VGB77_21190 [Abditibacteriaceae bacterium]|jgi:hypothetical protein
MIETASGSGRLRDADGNGIANKWVGLYDNATGQRVICHRTDRNGDYILDTNDTSAAHQVAFPFEGRVLPLNKIEIPWDKQT